MSAFRDLMEHLQPERVAQRVALPHDEARLRYPLTSNTVGSTREFLTIIADYYAYHVTTCVTPGGTIARAQAEAEAKQLVQAAYRRRRLSIQNAVSDAKTGTNGGLARVLDAIADGLRERAVQNYVETRMDRAVTLDSWEDKVAFMRDFLANNPALPPEVRAGPPERYAASWDAIYREYLDAVNAISSRLRGL